MPEFSQSCIDAAYAHLRDVDNVVRGQLYGWQQDHGTYWWGGDLFHKLAWEIAYQNMTGEYADSVCDKLRRVLRIPTDEPLAPELIERLADVEIKESTGLTLNKSRAVLDLSRRVSSGELTLDLSYLDSLQERELEEEIKGFGIGPTTINHYRRYTLGHLDVINPTDHAIQRGLQLAYHLPSQPTSEQAEALMAKWSPYRAVGQWHMWELGQAKKA